MEPDLGHRSSRNVMRKVRTPKAKGRPADRVPPELRAKLGHRSVAAFLLEGAVSRPDPNWEPDPEQLVVRVRAESASGANKKPPVVARHAYSVRRAAEPAIPYILAPLSLFFRGERKILSPLSQRVFLAIPPFKSLARLGRIGTFGHMLVSRAQGRLLKTPAPVE